MNSTERAALRDALLAETICGDTATPRESVVRNAEMLAAGDPDKFLGFDFGAIGAQEVMDIVARYCGCSPSLRERTGPGVIDVDLTLDELSAFGDRLAQAAERGERVLLATGHPTGILVIHMAVARALQAAGCKLVTPRSGERLADLPRRVGNRVRYLDSVACLTDGGQLYHTHASWPMDALLDAIDPPDLVVADHGFAGAAIVRGVETISFADVNDPALFVAKDRGMTQVVVPLDDNREPERYAEITGYLLGRIGSPGGNSGR